MQPKSLRAQTILWASLITITCTGWVVGGSAYILMADENLELGAVAIFLILLVGIYLAIAACFIIHGLINDKVKSSRAAMFLFPILAIISLSAFSTPPKYDFVRQIVSLGLWIYIVNIFVRNYRRVCGRD